MNACLVHKGKKMKKLATVLLLATITLLPLAASSSWIGMQGFSSQTNKTTTYSNGPLTIKEESSATLGGITLAGSFYSGDSPFGVGLQLGKAKIQKATNGSSDEDVSDYPLTWRGGISGLYRLGLSDKVALEFGLGLLFDRMTRSANSGGSEVLFFLDSLSLSTAANLLVALSDNFSLVGGITALSNLHTVGTVQSGSFSYDREFKVSGYTLEGQVGVAFSL